MTGGVLIALGAGWAVGVLCGAIAVVLYLGSR